MFKLDLSLDAAPISAAFLELQQKHLPFVLALTATRLAQRVKKGTIAVMKQRLDRPTPTTLNSLFVKYAVKNGQPAKVYFKDSWTSGIPADTYLQQAVGGGQRPHKRFEKALIARGIMRGSEYAIPTAPFMNQYGNVSRGTMTKILSGLGAAETRTGYQANASGSARSKRKGNALRFFSGDVGGSRGVPGYDHLHGVPFALELLEPDYLPIEYTDFSKGIVQGVERNSWRRVRAYHLLKTHPGDVGGNLAQKTKRVPVEQMIHIAHRKRIGQNRGQPLLHAVLIRLADIKDYEESERVAARISAALAMYIKKGIGEDFVPPPAGETRAERTFPIAPGIVIDTLLPGEDIGMIESNRPNPFLEGFRNGQLKAVAAGTRSTYSSVARSYDGTYSAQRQELVEGQLGYDLLQHEFIDYWCRPVYREWLRMAIVSGQLVVPPDVDPRTIYGAFYQGPVMPWINPVHEATAWKLLVEAGFADEAEVVRSRQRNPTELKASRTAEVEANREAGLVFSSDYYHQIYGKNQPNDDEKQRTADAATGRDHSGD